MPAQSFGFGSLTLRPDGILHAVFDFDEDRPPGVAEEYLAARAGLVGSDPPPVVVEIINIPYVDRSIREFLLGAMPPPPCRAVVSADQALITMFRTYQMVEPTAVPTEFFSAMDAAIDWIRAQTAEA